MIWRFTKDLLLSGVISVCLLGAALLGLLQDRALGSDESRPAYKVRARETMRGAMEFVISPVKRPHLLVPDFLEETPLIGDASLALANAAAFPPGFWMIVAFVGIRINRRLKVVTAEKLGDHFKARFGYLARIGRSHSGKR